jgi:type I restriction enzyme S subunit
MSDVLNLPKTWVQVTAADLGKVVSGGTPSTKENSYWGGNISWISPSDLTGYSSKHISKGAKSITQEGLRHSSATIMPAGSIHFSSRAPIGYTVISSCDMTTNQGFKSLVPAQGVFNEYIYYYFKSAKQLAESKATGTTFKEISGAAFNKLPVPLPPTNEQHRIVAKIEELFSELDKGIENLKTARAQLKVYRQALLKHAFEGKLTAQWRAENRDKLETANALLQRIQQERAQRYQQQLADWQTNGGSKPKAPKLLPPMTATELAELPELPEGWVYTRVGAVIDDPTYGTSKKCDYEVEGAGVLRIPNVISGKVDASDLKFAQFTPGEIATYKLSVGDILIIRSNGSVSIVGKCALVSNADLDYLYAGYLIRLRPHLRIVEPGFLLNTFSLHSIRRQIEQKAKSTSGVNNINTGEIQSLVVALCGIEEQKEIQIEIEARLSSVDQLELTITTALQQAEALRQSILKRAFSGHLVPQDPHDEPATALLARIKAESMRHTEKSTKSISRSKRND